MAGDVVLLNGVSSSGKTAISAELQHLLPRPFLRAGIDTFAPMLPERLVAFDPPEGDPAEQGIRVETRTDPAGPSLVLHPGPVFRRLIFGMHAAIAAMARAGNDIIFDDVIYDPAYFQSYLEAFEGVTVWFVGVRIPLEVVEQRERQRGDRAIGHARGHFDLVHRHGEYDIEVDAAVHSAKDCAQDIAHEISRQGAPRAFAAGRARRHT